MQKFGNVKLYDKDGVHEEFQFLWAETAPVYERLDVFQDPSSYNVVDTSTCVAAYYRKKEELITGDKSVIRKIFRIKNEVSTFHTDQSREVTIEDGKIIINITKSDPNDMVYYHMKMVQGVIVSEVYRTGAGEINITSFDQTDISEFDPINLGFYEKMSVLPGFEQKTSTSEIHTIEYLLNKFPDLRRFESEDFVIVEDMETYRDRLTSFKCYPGDKRGVDIEATGLNVGFTGKDRITGVVLSWNEHNSTYYPFFQEEFDFNLPIECLTEIWEAVENLPKNVKVMAHNGLMEKKGFKHDMGKPVRVDVDTFILSILVNPIIRKGLHGLKPLESKFTGRQFIELDDIFIGPIRFNVLPKEIVKVYACPDGPGPLIVYDELMKKLPPEERNIAELEYKVLKVKFYNEYWGLPVNVELLQKKMSLVSDTVDRLGNLFRSYHRTSANINSNEVLQRIFYEELRAEVTVYTSTGKPSTSKDALNNIIKMGKREIPEGMTIPKSILDKDGNVLISGEELAKNKYPSLLILQKYRLAAKEKSAFERIQRKTTAGRVDFYINQVGTESGRQSSDAHQYSDAMKELVCSDSRHHFMWSCDWKQVELRILAFLAGEQDLIEMENDPDIDVHRAILSKILNKEIWEITAQERSDGKRVNFGVVYMMTAYGLAFRECGPKYTKEQLNFYAKQIVDFFNANPRIKELVKQNEETIRKEGKISTVCGRYRYFYEIFDPDVTEAVIKKCVRKGNNLPIQGFGADMLKMALVNYYNYIHEKGWDKEVDCDGVKLPMVRLMLDIHDEVLLSTHKSIPHEEIIKMCKECMELDFKGAPHMFAAPALVRNWYDGKDDAFEIPIRFRDEVVEEWEKGNRILHSDTYMDDRDEELIFKLEDYRKKEQDKLVKDSFYHKGVFTPSEEAVAVCIEDMVNDGLLETMKKHLISSKEEFSVDTANQVLAKRVLESKFSPYLNDLNIYRQSRIVGYMEDLIAKYHTVDEVAMHVRHPDLTHVIISAYTDKKQVKGWKQQDIIHLAVEKYFEKRGTDETLILQSTVEDASEDQIMKESLTDATELYDYVSYTPDGDVIINDDLVDDSIYDEDIEVSELRNANDYVERVHVFYLMNKVIIDLTGNALDSAAEEMVDKLRGMSSKKDYYDCYLMCGDVQVPAGFKLPYKPEEVEAVIRNYMVN